MVVDENEQRNGDEEQAPEPPPATPDIIEEAEKPEPPPATSDLLMRMMTQDELDRLTLPPKEEKNNARNQDLV